MTPENYISTDPGSEQDFVDKRLFNICHINALSNFGLPIPDSLMQDRDKGLKSEPLHENLMIDWEKLENPER